MKSIARAALLLLACTSTALAQTSGLDPSSFDPSVPPGDDFFQYVNGPWLRANPIPPDQTSWGTFIQLRERNTAWLREIIESIPPTATDTNPRLVRDFYRAAMDQAAIDHLGLSPLNEELSRIDAVTDADSLIALVAHHHRLDIHSIFEFSVSPDNKDSTRYAAQLWQAGLGLPERNYYLADDPDSKRIRAEYHTHVANMFALLGDAPDAAAAHADTILRLETALAKVSRTPVQNRDVEALYNKRTLDDLRTDAPQINWPLYFKTIGGPTPAYCIVGQPEFLAGAGQLITSTPIQDWRTYLRWRLLHATARFLSKPFEQEDFRFYGQTLGGAKEMRPRWKRAVHMTDDLLPHPLGRLYVAAHFPPSARDRVAAMVANIIAAYDQRLATRDWMADATKTQARAKLQTVMRKIGYPDKWRDFSKLNLPNTSYVANVFAANQFEFDYRRDRIGGPVNRTEWEMTPPTVNAYYDPSMNEIVFPAGILQPPFFDPAADDAVNYGAIGAVIGHEMTHGFDDEGCLFDAQGNMRNWWTPEDKKNFDARAKRLVDQFDACVAIDDLHVNGKLTLGENIADLGGLTIAYAAYQRSLGDKPAPVIDHLTGPQRFFLGYAQAWRHATRPETLRLRLRTDPHSPERFRTDVPCSNLDPFYDAFHIQPTDKMYRRPEDRVVVW